MASNRLSVFSVGKLYPAYRSKVSFVNQNKYLSTTHITRLHTIDSAVLSKFKQDIDGAVRELAPGFNILEHDFG